MAVNPLSPGVYIDELSVFPASVAPVATAIPAFIGYTETGPPLVATRITSMIEFEQIFGFAFVTDYEVDISDTDVTIDNTATVLSEYTLYYNLRMFFANGGGPCYIVSVGPYVTSAPFVDANDLIAGIGITEKVDEITLLVTPEAVSVDVTQPQRNLINSTMLDLCNKLKDRFSIIDVITDTSQTIFADAADFRNSETGLNNLKYGAAYYPSLNTLLSRHYLDSDVVIDDNRTSPVFVSPNNSLSIILNGLASSGTATVTAALSSSAPVGNVKIGAITFTAVPDGSTPTNIQFEVIDDSGNTGFADIPATAINLRDAINNHPDISLVVTAAITAPGVVTVSAKVNGTVGDTIIFSDPAPANVGLTVFSTNPGFLDGGINADKTLYNNITSLLQANTLTLYPASTMAGIYASVDRDRGVWKAPANVSINGVVAPAVNISSADQENLNVDAGSGKSINAIRAFAGKGILVWGARTLAGNDNEWRYVPVRRLFIFAEESIQEASEFVVFEPNDKNTWTRVKSLIGNFLTNLWRDGALAGATPAEAFFVKVGLGETMTAQDILEGKMIIQVGLAAVRPAEFIILQFSHKLQES